MSALVFLAARFKEPSTYAGLGMLLSALGIHLDEAILGAAIQVAIALAGLVAVLVPEREAAAAARHRDASSQAPTGSRA